ncbi:MAG TPA: STAS domain-containing protein [Gaiellales bacterium]|jgi:anti-anti-sigma factor|nr:STAS domain-containing protein [Gaiellales bacterium]
MEPAGELIVEKTEAAWLLRLRGEWDTANSPTLTAELEAVFAHGTRVLIDLRETTFLDSAVLGAIVLGRTRASRKADDGLVVVSPPGSWPRRLLDTVGFPGLVPVYDDIDAGLAAFRS